MNPVDRFNESTSLLYSKLYQGDFFFFDLWSINHLWSGFTIFLILKHLNQRYPFLKLFILLLIYEIIEIALIYFATNIFRPETIKDQITDILIGMAGALLATVYGLLCRKFIPEKHDVTRWHLLLFMAMTFSYAWLTFSKGSVCNSGNLPFFRNLILFALWTVWFYQASILWSGAKPSLRLKQFFLISALLLITILVNISIVHAHEVFNKDGFDFLITELVKYKYKIFVFPVIVIIMPLFLKLFEKLLNSIVIRQPLT